MLIDPTDAFLFDLDGTLVDSEGLTGPAIERVLAEVGVTRAFDPIDFHGRNWDDAAASLAVPGVTADRLAAAYVACGRSAPPALIPGARAFLCAALGARPVAIVTSSDRAWAELALGWLGVAVPLVCAGEAPGTKPDPAPYLAASALLGVPSERCVVFEDSVAGVSAGRAAGMRVVAVTGRSARPAEITALATVAIEDYSVVPERLRLG